MRGRLLAGLVVAVAAWMAATFAGEDAAADAATAVEPAAPHRVSEARPRFVSYAPGLAGRAAGAARPSTARPQPRLLPRITGRAHGIGYGGRRVLVRPSHRPPVVHGGSITLEPMVIHARGGHTYAQHAYRWRGARHRGWLGSPRWRGWRAPRHHKLPPTAPHGPAPRPGAAARAPALPAPMAALAGQLHQALGAPMAGAQVAPDPSAGSTDTANTDDPTIDGADTPTNRTADNDGVGDDTSPSADTPAWQLADPVARAAALLRDALATTDTADPAAALGDALERASDVLRSGPDQLATAIDVVA